MKEWTGRGDVLGVMPLEGIAPVAAALSAGLGANRTPNIINAAVQHCASAAAAQDDVDELCTITRHGVTQQIPFVWLTLGVACRGRGTQQRGSLEGREGPTRNALA